MNNRAKGRLALTVAALATLATLTPLHACETCPLGPFEVAPEAATVPSTQAAAKPIALKNFTKHAKATREAKQRTATATPQATKQATRKPVLSARVRVAQATGQPADTTMTRAVVDANAELVEGEAGKSAPPIASEQTPASPEPQQGAAEPASVDLVSADDFNDIDRAAWETNQLPKMMLTVADSRAELREDDSKWAQTSTIGKLFVAFGTLLTIGSAIRMFMA